jgi:hypothetical protein
MPVNPYMSALPPPGGGCGPPITTIMQIMSIATATITIITSIIAGAWFSDSHKPD